MYVSRQGIRHRLSFVKVVHDSPVFPFGVAGPKFDEPCSHHDSEKVPPDHILDQWTHGERWNGIETEERNEDSGDVEASELQEADATSSEDEEDEEKSELQIFDETNMQLAIEMAQSA